MKKKKKFINTNVICDKCGYQNNPNYINFSGICHGCGKVLDEKAKFKFEMIKKMQLWRGKRLTKNEWNEISK